VVGVTSPIAGALFFERAVNGKGRQWRCWKRIASGEIPMADGPKFEDGQSRPEGIMDIHKGVDQDVPREG